MEEVYNKKYAVAILKEIIRLIVEFDSAKMKPNTISMTQLQYDTLKKYFSYFLLDNFFIYNKNEYRILINNDGKLGISLAFYSNGVFL